jgi:hypothetical protein
MSIVNTFLSKSAIVAGLIAMTLTTLPVSNATAQVNSRVVGNHNNVVINNNRGGGRGGYNRGYRGHRGGGNGGALLAGVVGGAILFSALNSSRSSRYDNHYYDRPRYSSRVDVRYGYGQPRYGYPYDRYRPRTRVVYVDRPVETVAPVYAQPTQAYYNQQPVSNGYQQQQQRQNSSCMQSREYQSTIEVGGRSVPAYGQACLQPDGSWKFGDPIAEPGF